MEHEGPEDREEREGASGADPEATARALVDAGLAIHKALGPGLLESAYEQCLAHELHKRGHHVRRQVNVPIIYDGINVEGAYRIYLLVDECIILEIKSVESIMPLHRAQILTYLRLADYPIGFIFNFNVTLFKDGIRRFIRTKPSS